MARQEFKLPDIGEGTAEAELIAWHVALGDHVDEDQPLCDVMTDKATVEVTSPFSGTLLERTGEPGEMLAVGSVVLVYEPDGHEVEDIASVSPDYNSVVADLGAHRLEEDEPARPRVLAAPALRKRAADLGIDLAQVYGSGPHGRVRQTDLDAYRAHYEKIDGPAPVPAEMPRQSDSPSYPQADVEEFDEVPVIGLRRRIAERLQDAKRRIPHFSYIEEVDMTQLDALRITMNQGAADHQSKLTLIPFLICALVKALPDFPQINAHFDDAAGVVRRYRTVHAGIATQTPSGLVVPVIRDAGRYDLWEISREVANLADTARAGRATASQLSGSTITITSLGAVGGVATTPVINSPEVAILGVNKMIERPVVRAHHIEIAKMMNLSASFDHRVVDGWDAALFIQRIKTLLETPALLFVA